MPVERRITEASFRESSARREQAVLALALRQHGVATLAQLKGLGMGERAVQMRAQCGRLHRVYAGVYSVVPAPLLSRRGRWLAAVLACGDGACLSHASVAAHLGIRQASGRMIDVTVGRESSLQLSGVRAHRSRLDPVDRVVVDGVPCTTFARTMLDLAATLRPDALKSCLDQAEMRRLDFGGFDGLLARSRGQRGVAKLRTLLTEAGIGLDVTRNELEERMRAICRAIGTATPKVNYWLELGDGRPGVELDFYWPEVRAAVEVDGAGVHGTIRAIERDYTKERRLLRAGIAVTRFSSSEVFRHPTRVGRELDGFLTHSQRLLEVERRLTAT